MRRCKHTGFIAADHFLLRPLLSVAALVLWLEWRLLY